MKVTNTKLLLVELFVINLGVTVMPSHPPTTVKRKLTYITAKATRKDAQSACSGLFNGSLVKDGTEAVTNMITLYQTQDWAQFWDNRVWIGMFVSDIADAPVYKWTSDCSKHHVSIFHRFDSIPVSEELEKDKRCIFEYLTIREWGFDDCYSRKFSSLCEENLGPCTYERDVITGPCTKGIVSAARIMVNSMEECEEYCTSIKPQTIDYGQCWSVTYVASSGSCFPAVDSKPYVFNVNSSGYQARCTHPAVISEGNDSRVSWKRCFEEPSVFTEPIPTSQPSAPYDPNDHCDIVPTTYSSETTQATEATSGFNTTQTTTVTAECRCSCIINELLSVKEKMKKLKKETSTNKRETSAHYRSLSSAIDNRSSARVVGMTLGVGVIMGVILVISLGDIVVLCRTEEITKQMEDMMSLLKGPDAKQGTLGV